MCYTDNAPAIEGVLSDPCYGNLAQRHITVVLEFAELRTEHRWVRGDDDLTGGPAMATIDPDERNRRRDAKKPQALKKKVAGRPTADAIAKMERDSWQSTSDYLQNLSMCYFVVPRGSRKK